MTILLGNLGLLVGLLAAAVAGARHSTVHLGPLGGPTGRGRVRLVLGRADSVVVASASDADALERAGLDRSRLSVRVAEAAEVAAPAGIGIDAGSNGQAHGERTRQRLAVFHDRTSEQPTDQKS